MNKTYKLLLLLSASLLLSACSEKEQYAQTVLAQMQNESDVKDYKLDPQLMADCVVKTSSGKMPGLFPFDPDRKKAYLSYIKLLTINTAKDPKQVMAELRTEFGSAQGLLDARSNYTDSLVECQTGFITNTESVEAGEPAQPVAGVPETAAAPAEPVPAPVTPFTPISNADEPAK
ncbi:MAG: hypothetical protein ABL903_00800 [Methylococcales bacterium]